MLAWCSHAWHSLFHADLVQPCMAQLVNVHRVDLKPWASCVLASPHTMNYTTAWTKETAYKNRLHTGEHMHAKVYSGAYTAQHTVQLSLTLSMRLQSVHR